MDDGGRKQHMVGIFDRAAATYDSVGPRFFTYFAQQLVESAQLTPGERVLDVATGRGAVLMAAAEKVGATGHVSGIDLAPDMIARTSAIIAERGLTQAEAQVMDAENLNFPEATFDVVLCGFAVFFFPDYAKALAGFRRVLNPGGRLAVSTWGAGDNRYDWQREVIGKYAPPGVREQMRQMQQNAPGPAWDKPAGLQAVLSDEGFTHVSVTEVARDFYYATEQEWLDVQWSHGARTWLEVLPPDLLPTITSEMFERLRAMRLADGIPQHQVALVALAKK